MFTLTIETANAAFEDHAGAELARILRNVADKVERDIFIAPNGNPEWETETGRVIDLNGNTVGEWSLRNAQTTASAALDAIAGLMHGEQWDADTTERVAEIVRETGREIGDPNET